MLNNLKDVSSAKAFAIYSNKPNYQQMAVENQNKQTEIMTKNSKASSWQFWAMFIGMVLSIIVAIIK